MGLLIDVSVSKGVMQGLTLAGCAGVLLLLVMAFFPRFEDQGEAEAQASGKKAGNIRSCMLHIGQRLERSLKSGQEIPDGYAEGSFRRVVAYYSRKGQVPGGASAYKDSVPEISLIKLKNDMGFVLLSPNGYSGLQLRALAGDLRKASKSDEVSATLQAVPAKLLLPGMAESQSYGNYRGDGVFAYWHDRHSDNETSQGRSTK